MKDTAIYRDSSCDKAKEILNEPHSTMTHTRRRGMLSLVKIRNKRNIMDIRDRRGWNCVFEEGVRNIMSRH